MLEVCTLCFHAGIAGHRLLRPYFLLPRLTVYHSILRNVPPELLQDVDLHTRIHLWFMHDGVTPHFLFAVWKLLNCVFPKQWIEEGAQQNGLPFPQFWIPENIQSQLFRLQKSVTSRTCNDEQKMNLRWFVEQLEFSSEWSTHRSHAQRPVLNKDQDQHF